jgi:Rrf2 family protein
MKISTRGRYAVRFLLDVAQNQADGYVSVRDVSTRQNISRKYLEQILPLITSAGLVRATRGSNGGYKLVKEPSEYSVSEILKITENSLAPVSCLDSPVNECERADTCQTLPVWIGLYEVIENYLDNITLQDIIDGNVNSK